MTAADFCQLLVRSRLHPAEEVKQQLQRWQAEAKGKSLAEDFAAWLVAQRHLTDYQANLLLNKKTDSFFVDQYKILDRVGKRRMAGVYQAVHASGQVVALKILPPSKAKDEEVLARFRREARLATRLQHPNVVRTFHIGEAGGLHYLVMEFLDGDTLAEVLKARGKLPAKEAVRVAFLAALGLQHIHEKGLVHRDLKPGNLMLVPAPAEHTLRSMVKIMDIGLGRALFEGEPEELTSEGTLIGTPEYLAPEQARDARRADIRSDIYSLGCTLYHTLTGQAPFADANPVRQVLRHATEAARSLKEFHPDAPDGLQQIVSKMLAKESGERYQNPKQVVDALKAFLAHDSEPKPRPEPVELKSYQEWLDKSMAAEPMSPPAGDAPVALAEPPAEEGGDKRPRKKGKVDAAPVARSALIEIDVEPLNEADFRPLAPFGLKIPRDAFMILIGALGMLGIVSLIWLLTVLLTGYGDVPLPDE